MNTPPPKPNPWLPVNMQGQRFLSSPPTKREPRPAKIPAQMPLWQCQIPGLEVRASTKSEARAHFKKTLGVERLAPGFMVFLSPESVAAKEAG